MSTVHPFPSLTESVPRCPVSSIRTSEMFLQFYAFQLVQDLNTSLINFVSIGPSFSTTEWETRVNLRCSKNNFPAQHLNTVSMRYPLVAIPAKDRCDVHWRTGCIVSTCISLVLCLLFIVPFVFLPFLVVCSMSDNGFRKQRGGLRMFCVSLRSL